MPAHQLMPEKKGKGRIVSLPFNPSSQALMKDHQAGEIYPYGQAEYMDYRPELLKAQRSQSAANGSPHFISGRQWITVVVLFFVNLINYMDRLTIAGKSFKFRNLRNPHPVVQIESAFYMRRQIL